MDAEVTIRGDTDGTFRVASPGRARIGTVEYDVWVTSAGNMDGGSGADAR